jgi:hypothetical protein
MEPSRTTKIWRTGWMLAAMAAIGGVVYLLVRPAPPRDATPPVRPPARTVPDAVHIDRDGTIRIAEDSPLYDHLTTVTINPRMVAYPALTVSGSILARIRQGTEPIEDRWQFSNSDLATKYSEWLRTTGEVDFAASQLAKTLELVKAQTDYLTASLHRIEPLAKSGNIPEKELKAAQAELLKAQLQGEKDVFSARSTLRVVTKTKSALERDLSQNGIEPVVFSRAVENMVLIAANVPESKVSQVHENQGCLARFYAYPDRSFAAHVETLSPLLSDQRRTLRVLFELSDPESVLRPGMFAEVGLGTDDREALMIPADALLHINQEDYVVVGAGAGKWRVAAVRAGEEHEGTIEILRGLSPGSTIVGSGAILLKPAVRQALTQAAGGKDQ